MSETNMRYWDAMKHPPESTLKKIMGGRLSGMTDIKPQWRYEIMTKTFGPCGEGWKFTIDKLWTEAGAQEQVMAFALVSVYHKTADGQWSEPTQGIGGSMLVAKEAGGLHTSDEGYKMAVTDALSVSMKLLGVGADIYNGYWDGSKYKDTQETPVKTASGPSQTPTAAVPAPTAAKPASTSPVISEAQSKRLYAIAKSAKKSDDEIRLCLSLWGYEHSKDIKRSDYEAICKSLEFVEILAPGEVEVPF